MVGTVSKKRGRGKGAGGETTPKPRAAPATRRGARRTTAGAPRYHPGPPIDSEAALEEATSRLLALDCDVVGRLLAVGGPPPLRWREPGFSGLAGIIVSQQVSVASANAIFGRLTSELAPLSPASLIAADDATLKRCGLSQGKMRALRALAEATAGGLDLEALGALDAGDAHDALVAVKGIGPWTADLFLLFSLGHPDAFPAGDLALQEATRIALRLRARPDAPRLERIAERWRPLRGVAARMLWAYYRGVKRREGVVGR
ncbi:MAG: DNA-3-methyladenine glycosylase family protein [Roseiarcus sp.]